MKVKEVFVFVETRYDGLIEPNKQYEIRDMQVFDDYLSALEYGNNEIDDIVGKIEEQGHTVTSCIISDDLMTITDDDTKVVVCLAIYKKHLY